MNKFFFLYHILSHTVTNVTPILGGHCLLSQPWPHILIAPPTHSSPADMKAITALGCHWEKWGVTRFMGALGGRYGAVHWSRCLHCTGWEHSWNLTQFIPSCKTHYAQKWTSPSICRVAVCGHRTSPELDSQWCTIWIRTKEVTPEIKGGYIEARRQDNEYVAV